MEKNLTKTVTFELNYISKDINAYLEKPYAAFSQVSMFLASSADFAKTLSQPDVDITQSSLASYVKSVDNNLTKSHTGVEGVNRVYAYVNDQLIFADTLNIPANYEIQNTAWYKSGLKNLTPKYTKPYRDYVTDKMIVSLCQRVTDVNGATRGVLSLDLDLEWIHDYFKKNFPDNETYGILFNDDGLVISHPQEDKRFRPYENLGPGYEALGSLFKYNELTAHYGITNVYGVKSNVFFQKMPNGWTLGMVIPNSVYYRGVYYTLGTFLTCALALFLLICHLVLRISSGKKQLEAESLNKTTFLTRISHEIRTHMNAIVGMTELLSRTGEKLPHRAQVYCENIKLASGKLLSIINDILDFSNIDYGSESLVNDRYTISSLISDVTNITKTRFTDDDIYLVVNLDPKLPNNVFGDVLKVRQCLLNMLFVDLNYLKHGCVCLEVTGEMDGIHVVLTVSVKDNGPGLSHQTLAKLLDDGQSSALHCPNAEGAHEGLGLAKRLSEAMGGHVEVYSTRGQGSVFSLTLPQVAVGADPVARVNDTDNVKVLVFEKRLPMARSLSYNLSALGVKHELVSTAERFGAKTFLERWSHLILPAPVYPELSELISIQSSESRVGLIIRESQPTGLTNVNFLPTPVHSQSLANFLNNYSFSYADRRLAKSPGTAVKMPGAKVLVVDDLETNLIVAEGLMEDYGMTIELCRGGLEALELVKANDYDLVFMDHMMPGLDGVETTKLIRSLEGRRFARLPIVALTANAIHGTKEMFLERGLNDFIPKPIDSHRLEEVLLHWIPKEKQITCLTDSRRELADESGREGPLTGQTGTPSPNRPSAANGPSKGLPDLGSLGALDTAAGLSMSGGKETNYRRILKVFLIDADKAKDILEGAIAGEDCKEYAIHIHSLKGATATIGAQNLSELAKELESAGNHHDIDLIKANTPVFLESLRLVAEKAKAYLKKNEEGQAAGREISGRDLVKELRKLSKAFEEIDTKTIGLTLTRLKESALTPEMAAGMDEITDCFFEVEYDKAVTLIQRLLAILTGSLTGEPEQAKNLMN
jgi:signal transduction histidine kinase/CheY-like chemotaxis protein